VLQQIAIGTRNRFQRRPHVRPWELGEIVALARRTDLRAYQLTAGSLRRDGFLGVAARAVAVHIVSMLSAARAIE
jgi:hypothetical protein